VCVVCILANLSFCGKIELQKKVKNLNLKSMCFSLSLSTVAPFLHKLGTLIQDIQPLSCPEKNPEKIEVLLSQNRREKEDRIGKSQPFREGALSL
jgi:hypothetical protein